MHGKVPGTLLYRINRRVAPVSRYVLVICRFWTSETLAYQRRHIAAALLVLTVSLGRRMPLFDEPIPGEALASPDAPKPHNMFMGGFGNW